MLPWGHLAVGYLLYTAATRLVRGRAPGGAEAVALAVGTQLPDLIDKPANWWFGFLDGRGVGHSLFFVVPLCALAIVVAHRRDRPALGVAFAVGILSHLPGDARGVLLDGDPWIVASYLFWPLVEAPIYEKDSLWDHVSEWIAAMEGLRYQTLGELLTGPFGVQLAMFAAILAVWAIDGFPGVGFLWHRTVGAVRSTPR